MIARTLALLVLLVVAAPLRGQDDPGRHAAFRAALDEETLGLVAVQTEGRVKTLDSFAREMTGYVTGRRAIDGQSAVFTYFDFMLRPEAYASRPVIFVPKKLLRSQIVEALESSMDAELAALAERGAIGEAEAASVRGDLRARLDDFFETGLIAEPMLQDDRVIEMLGRLEADVLRGAKQVRALRVAMTVRRPETLRDNLRLVPPSRGPVDAPWTTIDTLAHASDGSVPEHATLVEAWGRFVAGWRALDADAVNAQITVLATTLPRLNPSIYPTEKRRASERWYFAAGSLTQIWIAYALAMIPLLLHVVFRWRAAHWIGLALFAGAFALHTVAIGLRWYVAGRWPNSNMFEAVTTAAWFGGCFALVLEVLLRRTPVRGLFALASSAASGVALMAAHFLPVQLDPRIGNMMPVLHDVWLYIHTNVIIFSYCLIFMASISALLYLIYRLVTIGRGRGRDEYATVGGAASLIMTAPDGGSYLARARTTTGQVLDGTTMILLELSFVLLWAGIVMGAIWADHSWGRPWGWDPKEVFALNTFLVFALLIHTRLKVRDKGLWTAVLAIVGCVVMLFNWVVINFTIAGLHSYA